MKTSVMCLRLTRHLSLYETHLRCLSSVPLNRLDSSFNTSLLAKSRDNRPLNRRTPEMISAFTLSTITEMRHKCWKCGQPLDSTGVSLFCRNCNSLQAMDSTLNYFDLFDLKVTFDVDLNYLNDKMRSLQMATHPDKYTMSCQTEFDNSVDNSSLVNKAYKTLRDPYERGLYLLKLMNQSIEESHSSGETGIDSQFLSDIMELNEVIEESESKQKLLSILETNQKNIKDSIAGISEAFRSHDICRAKGLLAKFKFFSTIETNLKQKLENELI